MLPLQDKKIVEPKNVFRQSITPECITKVLTQFTEHKNVIIRALQSNDIPLAKFKMNEIIEFVNSIPDRQY